MPSSTGHKPNLEMGGVILAYMKSECVVARVFCEYIAGSRVM